MAFDLEGDADRLFDCFKCGTSTPESALKERKALPERSKKPILEKEEASAYSVRVPVDSDKLNKSKKLALKVLNGKHISPIVFYGSPHGAPIKRPLQILRLLREIHVDLGEQNDLLASKEVWATFPKQEEAIRFSRSHAQVHIFCYQDHLSGQRRYLVSTYEEFWRRYSIMDPKLRHHYEVIEEGLPCHLYFDLEFDKKANPERDVDKMGLPCHLYFDLEFDKKANPERDVDKMVDILISLTLSALFDKYSIQGNQESVIELDSSTEEKFSRHLIIHIPNTAFKDNSHVGAFIFEVCTNIATLRGSSDPQVDKLYIKKDLTCSSSGEQLFLDTAVYSRNRCFRLVLSSKAGKKSFLLPTRRFKCKNLSQKQLFMESLICRVDADCKKLLVCKMDLDCKKVLSFESEVPKQKLCVYEDGGSNIPVSYFSGISPFPALDVFIESIASVGNVSGKIRSWYWFSTYNLMIYSMSRSRYCERIGREHKSNHVMYIVDFQCAGYYQKCYDPDCRGYRSPLRSLPSDVMPNKMGLFNSVLTETCKGSVDINADLKLDDTNNQGQITDSAKKDIGWWQVAIQCADFIENSESAPGINKLDEDINGDFAWWMDVEQIVSQVENSAVDG